jgi:hypothetical protein
MLTLFYVYALGLLAHMAVVGIARGVVKYWKDRRHFDGPLLFDGVYNDAPKLVAAAVIWPTFLVAYITYMLVDLWHTRNDFDSFGLASDDDTIPDGRHRTFAIGSGGGNEHEPGK